jgi:hypothetical protein
MAAQRTLQSFEKVLNSLELIQRATVGGNHRSVPNPLSLQQYIDICDHELPNLLKLLPQANSKTKADLKRLVLDFKRKYREPSEPTESRLRKIEDALNGLNNVETSERRSPTETHEVDRNQAVAAIYRGRGELSDVINAAIKNPKRYYESQQYGLSIGRDFGSDPRNEENPLFRQKNK